MKAIMVMFDSLNRHYLPPYGCDWVAAPNFSRLANHSVVFENSYVGSLPCMPARRELHTGRYNFLHRSWGPLEPFDDSMPRLLSQHGVYTHLVSDHYHYWEEGGCTYHTRYNSWEASRGQEGDPWKGQVAAPPLPEHIGRVDRQDQVNRHYMPSPSKSSQARTFQYGLEFIEKNARANNWFLQIETFDPHEPFFSFEEFDRLYPFDPDALYFDWPEYGSPEYTPEQIQHLRYKYASQISMCDASLGRVLDAMDRHSLWDDTLLIVNTDHGFFLGDHGFHGKGRMPWYNELAHTPLFIWDPRCRCKDQRRQALVQTIDLAPTLLGFFGAELPAAMRGHDLQAAISEDHTARRAALFGMHGGHVNCTDGRYVYMRAPLPGNAPLYDYTVMPAHMRQPFSIEELQQAELAGPFDFTKGCRVLRTPAGCWVQENHLYQQLLFDLHSDPSQESPVNDPEVEKMMIGHLVRLMRENDAPQEQFERLGLNTESPAE